MKEETGLPLRYGVQYVLPILFAYEGIIANLRFEDWKPNFS